MSNNQFAEICIIYNYPQHYREDIFFLIDCNLKVDFYFGDKMDDVVEFSPFILGGFKGYFRNIYLYKNIYFQKGSMDVIFNSKYSKFIILGEYYCVNHWLLLLSKIIYRRRKIYLWTHGIYGNERGIKYLVKKLFYKLGDGFLLYGIYSKNLMVNLRYRVEFLNVVYNSFKYFEINKIFNYLSDQLYLPFDKGRSLPKLLFIGRLTYIKKIELLIRAVDILVNSLNFPVYLTIIGDGQAKEYLLNLVKSLNILRYIDFVGSIYDESALGPLIFNSDLCISPGNVGLTAIHCLSYGTPVATHSNFKYQMPEFEAIMHDKINGFFFEEDSSESIAFFTKQYLTEISILSLIEKKELKVRRRAVIEEKYNPNVQFKVISKILNSY